MKELFNRIIQTGIAGLIIWIIVLAAVNSQPGCCWTDANFCIPSLKKLPVYLATANSWAASLPCGGSGQPASYIGYHYLPADTGAGQSCCETDLCGRNCQASDFSLRFNQKLHPLSKDAICFYTGNVGQPALKPDNLPIVLSTVPIYILTQSIIC